MLIPFAPDEFWVELRKIVGEEIKKAEPTIKNLEYPITIVELSMAHKTLYKISEVCALFNVSRMLVDQWVRLGKLRKIKVGSRVYFLSSDIQNLIKKPH